MLQNNKSNGRVINIINNDDDANIKNIDGFKKNNDAPTSNLSENLLGVSTQTTTLSKLFFSPDNIKNLQNQIRYNVYKSSNNKYKIGEQNYEELIVIMRSIYLQYSPNLNYQYKKQIMYLNDNVIKWAVPKIINEIKQYVKYIDDVQNLPVPIDRPTNMSNTGMKNLRSVTDIF
tara:strand:+ start:81 stop:602 length:522 start_codon:yes stop_codon:yes gene_type:complete